MRTMTADGGILSRRSAPTLLWQNDRQHRVSAVRTLKGYVVAVGITPNLVALLMHAAEIRYSRHALVRSSIQSPEPGF